MRKTRTMLAVLVALVMVLGLIPGLALADAPQEVWVCAATGDDGNLGTADAPFATIKKGISTVATGGRVHVAAGEYTEAYIVINKPVYLMGANAGIPAADGTGVPSGRGAETVFTHNGLYVLSPAASGITIDGFKFTGGSFRLIDTYADSDYLAIVNCVFDTPGAGGDGGAIQFGGGSRLNLRLDHNLFTGQCHTSWLYLGGFNYDNLTISHNDFTGDAVRGIFQTCTPIPNFLLESNYFGPGIVTGVNMGTLDNPTIQNNHFDRVEYAAMQIGTQGGIITGNILDGAGTGRYFGPPSDYTLAYGIQLWGGAWGTWTCEGVQIVNNTVMNYASPPGAGPNDYHVGIYLPADAGPDVTVSGNVLENNGIGIRVNSDKTGISVVANTFADNRVQVLDQKSTLDLEAVLAANIFDRVVLVRGSGIKVPAIFGAIQGAVDAAVAGDTIEVHPATYPENVSIPAGKNGLVLAGIDQPTISVITGNAIQVQSVATISGFHLLCTGAQQGSAVKIPNGASSGTEEIPGLIQGNLMENFTKGVDYHSYGYGYWDMKDNDIRDCRLAIYLNNLHHSEITGNTFNNYNEGIGMGWDNDTAHNLLIENNQFLGTSDPTNKGAIMLSSASHDVAIRGNLMTGSTNGIWVKHNPANVVGLASVEVDHNTITGNLAGITNEAPSALDATLNYWGHKSGPEGDGDPVSGDVDYDPWYLDSEMTIRSNNLALTVTKQGEGEVSRPVGPYVYGQKVVLRATPDTDWLFSHWYMDEAYHETEQLTVLMDWPKDGRVVFTEAEAAPPSPPPPPPLPLPSVAQEIDPDEGGDVVTEDGKVVLDVPPGATDTLTTFEITQLPEGEVPEVPGTFTVAGVAIQITAEDEDGNPVDEFGAPLTLTFTLTPEQLGEHPEDLVIMYYDEELGWIELETTVNPETGEVTATFDHLTVFAVMRVAASPVDYGAQRVVMLVGETRYTADNVLKEMDVAPFVEGGSTFVPVRFLAEAFGSEVGWEAEGGTVTLTRPDLTITIEIGSKLIRVTKDGAVTVVESDVAAFLKDGRTMLPHAAIAEAFGAEADYGPKDAPVEWVSFEQ